MTSNIYEDQIVDEQYREIYESVLSTPSESEFCQSSDAGNPKRKSSRKRPYSKTEHLNLNFKKRKETTKERLLELNEFYSNTCFGIWIECTKCNKWRKCLEYEEEHQVPEDWCCSKNKTGIKNCDDPEDAEEVEFAETNFVPGSIVWAKLDGFPWWPGMVEDDPNIEEYYWYENGKLLYNVTFLDDNVTHAWVDSSYVQSYLKPLPRSHKLNRNYKNAHLVEDAKEKADAAIKMPIKERLQTFSFAKIYKGKWPQATDFDNEESENITKMLIKELEDIDFLMSSDSENGMNSFKAIEEVSVKLKSDEENKLQKVSKLKIKESNKEMNKKKSSELGKNEIKGSLEKTESVVAPKKKKEVQKKSSTITKKTSFTPPVRNETEHHKNEVNSKASGNHMNTDSRKSVTAHKNLNLKKDYCSEKTFPELVNELMSDSDESNSGESAVTNKDSDKEMDRQAGSNKKMDKQATNNEEIEKQAADGENQNAGLPNKTVGEIQVEVSSETEDRDLKCIADEEPISTDLPEAKINSKVVLENATQNKTNENISSKNLTAKRKTTEKGKLTRKINEILEGLDKDIKNSMANAPDSNNDENNLGYEANSETENYDIEKGIKEKKKYWKKANNKTSDVKNKRDQEKKNTIVNEKLENKFKGSKQNKKTCKNVSGIMKTMKSQPFCPVKQNREMIEVQKIETSHKTTIMEIEGNISRKNNAKKKGAVKKYNGVDKKSSSLSDSKITESSDQSTKTPYQNCESKISSYSLCLNNLNEEASEDEDSDPFELSD